MLTSRIQKNSAFKWMRPAALMFALATTSLFAADAASGAGAGPDPAQRPAPLSTQAARGEAPIVSTTPMTFSTVDGGVHGELAAPPEIVGTEGPSDLVYTISSEP